MAEFVHHANRILRAAGISSETRSAKALLEALAAHARDWADRAAALGGRMDAAAATRVAARTLATDAELHRRVEELDANADAVFARIQTVVDAEDAPPAPADLYARRRRWGREAQPAGSATASPFDVEAGHAASPAALLIGAPVFRAGGEMIGVIEDVMFGSGGEKVTGVRLSSPR